jgi:zinc protease
MRTTTVLVACLVLAPLAGFLALAQKGPKDKFTFPKLHEINMPKVREAKLKNDMRLFLVEDRQYPTIDLRALVGAASEFDPAEKVGLASLAGSVLRTGGTETMTGDDMDRMLETMGATVETGIRSGSGYVYVSVLKEDIDKGVNILADILMHPAFRQEKIDLAKIQERSIISRRNDDIWEITGREFNTLIYGKGNPYSRYPEYATIDSINRDDLVAFHKKYFHPNNIIFAAWGDFDAVEMEKKLETAFGAWPKAEVAVPAKPKVDYQYVNTVNFVSKPDVNQTHIQMGHIGGLMNSPDYPALVIMNQILSTDRMFKVIRTQEGLTYAPWGYYGAEYDHPGVFNCGTQTKSQTTVYAIRLMLKEVKRMTEEPVTDEELTRAKDTYLNSFVFNFDTRSKIVSRMVVYAYYDYPVDFINQIKNKVEKVTKEDVLRVAKTHLHPDQLQILVVGKKEDFDEPLSVLGKVNDIDITIPGSKH